MRKKKDNRLNVFLDCNILAIPIAIMPAILNAIVCVTARAKLRQI